MLFRELTMRGGRSEGADQRGPSEGAAPSQAFREGRCKEADQRGADPWGIAWGLIRVGCSKRDDPRGAFRGRRFDEADLSGPIRGGRFEEADPRELLQIAFLGGCSEGADSRGTF